MADYTIPTNLGLQKIMNVINAPLTLSTFELGDGGGESYDPTPDQTALVNSVYSGSLQPGAVYTDPDNPRAIVIEHTIPDTVGGFTIREAGVRDSAGDLLFIAKIAPSDKPIFNTGSTKQTTVRLIVGGVNKDDVDLVISAANALATMQWVVDNFIPSGTDLDGYLTVVQSDERYLAKDQNLDDLPNKSLSRFNLGVPYASQMEAEAGTETDKVMSPATTLASIRNAAGSILNRGTYRLASVTHAHFGQPGDRVIVAEVLRQFIDDIFIGQVAYFASNTTGINKGWIPIVSSNATVGPPGSGAAYSQDDQIKKLFVYLWNNTRPSEFLIRTSSGVVTTKGASAEQDWQNLRRIHIPSANLMFARSISPGPSGRYVGSFEEDQNKQHTHGVKEGSEYPVTTGSGELLASGEGYTRLTEYQSTTTPEGGSEARPKNLGWLTMIYAGVDW